MVTTNSQTSNKKEQLSDGAKLYLILYNALQFFGWIMMFYSLCNHFSYNPNPKKAFKNCSTLLYLFQTAAILEILHAALGLVKSNVLLTFFQVFSRVFLVWGISYSVPESQDSKGVMMYLFAWSVTEIIRYLYYAINLINEVPYLIVWARYTFFIILYPLGVTGELLCFYAALPIVKKSQIYSIKLPNNFNISFDYYFMLILLMFAYIPIFPQLYIHMFTQRFKIIGKSKQGDKKSK